MKYIIISMVILLTGCEGIGSKDDLSGIYSTSYEHEFGITDDTIIVSRSNNSNKMYLIERHSGVVRKWDGKEFPKELITETWTLEYNADKKTLTELKKGKTLVWNSGSLSLQLGEIKYLLIAGK